MLLNWAIEEEQRMSDTYLIRPRINEKIWLLELNEEDKILTVYTALNVQLNEKEQGELKNLLLENNLNSLTINFSSYWERILNAVGRSAALAKVWLDKSSRQWEQNSLSLTVNDACGKEILEQKEIDKFIAELFFHDLGKKITVEFILAPDQESWEEVLQQEDEKYWESVEQLAMPQEEKKAPDKEGAVPGILLGKEITDLPVTLREIAEEEKKITVNGEIMELDVRELKNGGKLISFALTDKTDSLTVKVFEKEKQPLSQWLKKGQYLLVRGSVQYDKFSQELTMMAQDINQAEKPLRKDLAEEKRIELHLHTKMSDMDGTLEISELVKTLADWGHSAVAITDHGAVQGFPIISQAAKKQDFKVIYGVEGYLVNDGESLIAGARDLALEEESFVVFDLETSGLNPQTAEIIEIGAVKIEKGKIAAEYKTFVAFKGDLPVKIIELTGIDNHMLAGAPGIKEVLAEFMDFIGDSCLVAHNAKFDVGFLNNKLKREYQKTLTNPVADTLTLARILVPELKNHKLNTLTKHFKITLENHHRALDDAKAAGFLWLKLLDILKAQGLGTLAAINTLQDKVSTDRLKTYHIILLVKNLTGLENLYRLISLSHTKYFYRKPRIPRSELIRHREGLIIGSACEAGELIQAYLGGADFDKLKKIADFYDYLEIQPIGNNYFMLEQGLIADEAGLQKINQTICQLGEEMHKPVAATGDVHFLQPEDAVYREILLQAQGFPDADKQPPLYLKTTEEMLADFAYLGDKKAREVVIDNTHLIADWIEPIQPVPNDFCPPEIEGAEDQIKEMAYTKAYALYGDPLPDEVKKVLEKELNSIISNGFSVLYLIAHKLVKKSLDDGYLVGSRGSVGSSLVAYLCDITEVNALPPHYLCPHCRHSIFVEEGTVGTGFDLPDKLCPQCSQPMKKDGLDIPFEVFLGFNGDKVPDIDLNFSGEYQGKVHKYTEELFGSGYVFKAGTIATVAEKTAYGFVKNYCEEKNLLLRQAELNRLAKGCTGVKRTTGQHPGGVIVVPKNTDIHRFCPIQYPANDKNAEMYTSHFDYHSIDACLVKLDILGHDDPTAIRMLQDLTGVDPKSIPLDDPETMKIFSGLGSLGVTEEELGCKIGTIAIPEFGTKFVRQMLEDTMPTTFAELVRIAGLSHGTDVWLNNAQDLVRDGVTTLPEVISTRDDIMIYLLHKGLEPIKAFKIMENVRKGKGVSPEFEADMREKNVPDWYISSCKKIKYMFPKGHAAAYVMMAFRIAYFKVHYPLAFYATYFSVRADEFNAGLVRGGVEGVRSQMQEIIRLGKGASAKEKNQLTVLEVLLEAFLRGVEFLPLDLYRSDVKHLTIEDGKLRLPLASLQGLGESVAQSIVSAREEQEFTSIEDLRERGRASKSIIDMLQEYNCLTGLPETNQLMLFG